MGWTWGTACWPGPPARTISRPRGASASVSTMTGSRSRRCRGSRRSSGTTSQAQVQPSSHGPAASRSPERSAVDDSSALGDSDVLSAARRRRRFGGLAPRAAGGEGKHHEQRDRSHPASWAPSRARGLLEVFRATQKHHGCPLTMVIPVCQTAHYAPPSGRDASCSRARLALVSRSTPVYGSGDAARLPSTRLAVTTPTLRGYVWPRLLVAGPRPPGRRASAHPRKARAAFRSRAIDLRETLYDLFSEVAAGESPAPTRLRTLNDVLAISLAHVELATSDDGGFDTRWSSGRRPGPAPVADGRVGRARVVLGRPRPAQAVSGREVWLGLHRREQQPLAALVRLHDVRQPSARACPLRTLAAGSGVTGGDR